MVDTVTRRCQKLKKNNSKLAFLGREDEVANVKSDVMLTSPRKDGCKGDHDGSAVEEEKESIKNARDESPLFSDARVSVAFAQS